MATFAQFKASIVTLIREIILSGDQEVKEIREGYEGQIAQYQAQVSELESKAQLASSQADESASKVSELLTALAEKDQAQIAATSAAAAKLADDLNALTTELVNEFGKKPEPLPDQNPTLIADVVVGVIIGNDDFDTTDVEEMTEADAIDEPEPTPVVVVDTALKAIEETEID